ncbi:hypothetical protein WCX72_11550 [Sulfurimonas sp. HSL1-6]|uniref:WD40/YVTN/BNR-like repeat-containing protein n=1 Tax=Thiomicrolovo immobilis TaxID=3131935 RepID=UPI0031F7914F
MRQVVNVFLFFMYFLITQSSLSSETTKLGSGYEEKLPYEHWEVIGPGFTNVISNAVIRDDDIYVLIDIGGLVYSGNSGKSWQHLTHYDKDGVTTRRFFDFDVSPTNTNIIAIAGDGIFLTNDHGRKWVSIEDGLPIKEYGKRKNSFSQIKFSCNGKRVFAGIGTKIFMPIKHIERMLLQGRSEKYLYVMDVNTSVFHKINIDIEGKDSVVKKIYPHPYQSNILYVSFEDGSFYKSLNADGPVEKIRFQRILLPHGYFVRDLVISSVEKDTLLMSLTSLKHKSNSILCKVKTNSSNKIHLERIDLYCLFGVFPCKIKDTMSVALLPGSTTKLLFGSSKDSSVYLYDLVSNKTMTYDLPEELYADFGHFYGAIERVFTGTGPNILLTSKIGAWLSKDGLKSFEPLWMIFSNNLFGNKGVSAIGNVDSLSITNNYIYAGTYDHSAWRFDVNSSYASPLITKIPKTMRLGKWSWLGTHVFASEDDQFIYIEDDARSNKFSGHHMNQDKKFFLSKDRGETWTDITLHLGKGEIFPGGSLLLKVLFEKKDSQRQWWLFSDELYRTIDGGQTFTLVKKLRLQYIKQKIVFTDIAFDDKHEIVYLSSSVGDANIGSKLNRLQDPAALYKSIDNGKSWHGCDVGQDSIKSLALKTDGALVIGTMKSQDQPGRLIILPYGEAYSKEHIKMQVGSNKGEVMANQLSFWPVIVDGKNILVYSNTNWVLNDESFAQGPFLSRDNGKTFFPVKFDLPNTNIYSAAMKNGLIVLGTTFGIMRLKFDENKKY